MEIINTRTANPIGQAPTFDNNILKKVIVNLVEVMKTDFGQMFKKQFTDDDSLANYKRRLYQKLDKDKYTPEVITSGYERFVANAPTFPPSVPVLINYIDDQVARVKVPKSHRIEKQQYSDTIDCNIQGHHDHNALLIELGKEPLKMVYTTDEIAKCKETFSAFKAAI
jgi:hypothetical protein